MRKKIMSLAIAGILASLTLAGCGDTDTAYNDYFPQEDDSDGLAMSSGFGDSESEDYDYNEIDEGEDSASGASLRTLIGMALDDGAEYPEGIHDVTDYYSDHIENLYEIVNEYLDGIVGSWTVDTGEKYPYTTIYERDIEGLYKSDYMKGDDYDGFGGVVKLTCEVKDYDVILYYSVYDINNFYQEDAEPEVNLYFQDTILKPDTLVSTDDITFVRTGEDSDNSSDSEGSGNSDDQSYSGDIDGITMDSFIGTFENEDEGCTIEIKKCTSDYHEVRIKWVAGVEDGITNVYEWSYYPYYDAENARLYANKGVLYYVWYDENGELQSGDQASDDEMAYFYFDNGNLIWVDRKNHYSDDVLFECVD